MLQRWLERNDFRVHSTYAHICANKQISLCIKTRIDKEDMLTMDERCVSKRKAIGNSEFFTALVVCFVHFICSLSRKVRKRSDIFRICVQLKFSPRIRSTNQIHQTHRDKFSVCTGCSCVFQFHETKAIWGAFLRGVPQEFTPFHVGKRAIRVRHFSSVSCSKFLIKCRKTPRNECTYER